MSAKNLHGDISEVGLAEIQLVSPPGQLPNPLKQEPLQDTSDGSSELIRNGGGGVQHATDTPAQNPSNRRDNSAADAGNSQKGAKDRISKGASPSSKNQAGSNSEKSSVKPKDKDKAASSQDKSIRLVDRSTRRNDRSVRDGQPSNLDASTRSTTRDRVNSVLQRVMAVGPSGAFSHPKDPRRIGVLERPKPNAGEKSLLDAANVSHDFFVAFSEVKWIANLSEGDMGEVHRVRWRGVDCAAKTAKGNGASSQRSQL